MNSSDQEPHNNLFFESGQLTVADPGILKGQVNFLQKKRGEGGGGGSPTIYSGQLINKIFSKGGPPLGLGHYKTWTVDWTMDWAFLSCLDIRLGCCMAYI